MSRLSYSRDDTRMLQAGSSKSPGFVAEFRVDIFDSEIILIFLGTHNEVVRILVVSSQTSQVPDGRSFDELIVFDLIMSFDIANHAALVFDFIHVVGFGGYEKVRQATDDFMVLVEVKRDRKVEFPVAQFHGITSFRKIYGRFTAP